MHVDCDMLAQQKAHACTGTKVMMSVLRTWQHLTFICTAVQELGQEPRVIFEHDDKDYYTTPDRNPCHKDYHASPLNLPDTIPFNVPVMEDTGSGLAISARQQKFELSACSQPSSPSMFFSDWYPGSMDFTRASASPMDMNSCFVMSTVIESFGRSGQVAGLEKEEMKF